MRKLTVILGIAMGASISHAATIINADSALITGTGFANHYGKYGQFFAAVSRQNHLPFPHEHDRRVLSVRDFRAGVLNVAQNDRQQ